MAYNFIGWLFYWIWKNSKTHPCFHVRHHFARLWLVTKRQKNDALLLGSFNLYCHMTYMFLWLVTLWNRWHCFQNDPLKNIVDKFCVVKNVLPKIMIMLSVFRCLICILKILYFHRFCFDLMVNYDSLLLVKKLKLFKCLNVFKIYFKNFSWEDFEFLYQYEILSSDYTVLETCFLLSFLYKKNYFHLTFLKRFCCIL